MQTVIDAIREKQLLHFTYHGIIRIVEPHILGVCNGETQLLSYQVGGYSNSGKIPEWRRFDLKEMIGTIRTRNTFSGPREENVKRSSEWDRIIVEVR